MPYRFLVGVGYHPNGGRRRSGKDNDRRNFLAALPGGSLHLGLVGNGLICLGAAVLEVVVTSCLIYTGARI